MNTKTHPRKLLERRYSDVQNTFINPPNSPTFTISSDDYESESENEDEVNILKIEPDKYKTRQRKFSAFGRTVMTESSPRPELKRRLSTEKFWEFMPDKDYEFINRMNRPTVAGACRMACTPVRRFNKEDIRPKTSLPRLSSSNNTGFHKSKSMMNVSNNNKRIAVAGKDGKGRRLSQGELKGLIERLHEKNNKSKEAESKSNNNDITLSYMWTGKDASNQRIHQCQSTIKTNARASYERCSSAFQQNIGRSMASYSK